MDDTTNNGTVTGNAAQTVPVATTAPTSVTVVNAEQLTATTPVLSATPEHASKLQTIFENADAILAAAAKYEQLAKFLSSEFSHFKL
jgi:hypothetical protein